MSVFRHAVTWQYSAFLKTARGDVWRVWFDYDEQPFMQRLTPESMRNEYREPVDALNEKDKKL